MEYFSTKRFLFLVSSNKCNEELAKIDKFISILNKSGIGIIIENEKKKKQHTPNPPEEDEQFLILRITFIIK